MENLQANEILEQLRRQVIKSLHQTGKEGEAKDGMDISLCIFDHETQELQFSGAFNSIYHIRQGELTELKADRMPISIHWKLEEKFTNQVITIHEGDTVYMFSDGYADQFGGPEEKKIKLKAIKDLLLSVQEYSMDEQKERLEQYFDEWKGSLPQVDDVIVMGLKFN
jgi:serine phosphatase RsbU (regulator of sigma subunit)